jgi:hypothetical protein
MIGHNLDGTKRTPVEDAVIRRLDTLITTLATIAE